MKAIACALALFTVASQAALIHLGWRPSIDHDQLSNYRLYVNETCIDVGLVTTYAIELPPGSFALYVTAVDTNQVESYSSNTVFTNVPAPRIGNLVIQSSPNFVNWTVVTNFPIPLTATQQFFRTILDPKL